MLYEAENGKMERGTDTLFVLRKCSATVHYGALIFFLLQTKKPNNQYCS